jgi:hypothetical protein
MKFGKETACGRLREIIQSDNEYRYSDEYIRQELAENDCYEFDEYGKLV